MTPPHVFTLCSDSRAEDNLRIIFKYLSSDPTGLTQQTAQSSGDEFRRKEKVEIGINRFTDNNIGPDVLSSAISLYIYRLEFLVTSNQVMEGVKIDVKIRN